MRQKVFKLLPGTYFCDIAKQECALQVQIFWAMLGSVGAAWALWRGQQVRAYRFCRHMQQPSHE